MNKQVSMQADLDYYIKAANFWNHNTKPKDATSTLKAQFLPYSLYHRQVCNCCGLLRLI
jgi:hypothetical protein